MGFIAEQLKPGRYVGTDTLKQWAIVSTLMFCTARKTRMVSSKRHDRSILIRLELQPFSFAFTTPYTPHPYSKDCGLPNQ
ncbi:MAG: hypothetical protein KME27_11055 [Lyngbya sp. HA4199-MV5]|jgi:hypothetical protein|nr:hypothetical protein [Lyngbya sp. HA4199-MV5]